MFCLNALLAYNRPIALYITKPRIVVIRKFKYTI